jgi:hypothetical protein
MYVTQDLIINLTTGVARICHLLRMYIAYYLCILYNYYMSDEIEL